MASPATCSEPPTCRCDEDRQPCPVPQKSSSGADPALHTWSLPFPVSVHHQLPASASTAVASQAARPADMQQQHPITSW